MMDLVFWKSCFYFVVASVLLQLALAANINKTAIEDINGQYLLDLGRKMKDQTLQAIGIAFLNLGKNRCGDWTHWTSCTAGSLGYFGIKWRKMTCGDELSVEKSKIEFTTCGTLCPPDYDNIANRVCVKVHMSKKSYVEANTHCQTEGGYLTNIDSVQKYIDISKLNGLSSSDFFYVGGRRKDVNSPWMFEDGNKSGYFKWASGQPDNDANQLCLFLRGNSKVMYDTSCQLSRPFICEISM